MPTGPATHQRNSTRSPVHTFLGNHDFARLADVVDPALLPAAFSVLMTVPGIPAVYYGDELAVTSTWVQGGSDAVLRPAMSPDAAGGDRALLEAVRELGGFRTANPWLRSAALDGVGTHDGALTYEVTGDGRSIRVCVNPTATPVTFPPESGGVEVGARGWAIVGYDGDLEITRHADRYRSRP